jgi:ubiquinone/menaquinone biosynthesis C-methylase UbiE
MPSAYRGSRRIAGDLLEQMLVKARSRAEKQGLRQVEFVRVDMQDLPFADGVADVFLSYSGLHMVKDRVARRGWDP